MAEPENNGPVYFPAAVYDLAIRLGVKPPQLRSRIDLTQTGAMKRDLATDSWMAFTASQTIETRTCAFDWQARAGPLGLISGRDALAGGEGRLDIVALGFIPLVSAVHTPALVRGELMRYLAEIAWAPEAILCNPALCWRTVGRSPSRAPSFRTRRTTCAAETSSGIGNTNSAADVSVFRGCQHSPRRC